MKKLLFYICLIPCLLNGQELFISEPTQVSIVNTGSRAPHIAMLNGNHPIVYWGKPGGTPKLYTSTWENGVFNTPVEINTNGIEPDLWGSGLGPQLAAKGNTVFVVFEAYGEGIYCVKSDDGGQNYGLPVSVWDAPAGRVATLPGIAIDPIGNPIISFITTNFSEEEAQYEITKSTDGGLSFPPTTLANNIVPGDEVCECCPASIIAPTEEEVYLGFRNNNNNLRDIWIAQSIDNNANYTTATDIDDTDWMTFTCPISGPKLMDAGDQIYSIFYSASIDPNIYFNSINRSNMEAGNQFQIEAHYGQNNSQSHPAIAGNVDTIGVVWQEFGATGYDIVMAWSENGPDELTQNSVEISPGPLAEVNPDIVFSDGVFHIVYEDGNTSRVMYRTASFVEIVSAKEVDTNDFSIEIYPNPASDKVVLTFNNHENKVIHIQLFDNAGRLLNNSRTTNQSIEIDCTSYPAGSYFLNLKMGEMVSNRSFIIK